MSRDRWREWTLKSRQKMMIWHVRDDVNLKRDWDEADDINQNQIQSQCRLTHVSLHVQPVYTKRPREMCFIGQLYKPYIERVQALADISRSALCCINETRAPIANPSNSAQLEGTPSNLHLGPCSSVGMQRGRHNTDTQTAVTTIHRASKTSHRWLAIILTHTIRLRQFLAEVLLRK